MQASPDHLKMNQFQFDRAAPLDITYRYARDGLMIEQLTLSRKFQISTWYQVYSDPAQR